MNNTVKSVEKLQEIFYDAWLRIKKGNRPVCVSCDPSRTPDDEEFWTMYMNFLDVLVVDEDDLLESFDDMVNFGFSVKESVCVRNPCNVRGFLLVDRELAEKCLVLGVLA
jgi:hypothetical protein